MRRIALTSLLILFILLLTAPPGFAQAGPQLAPQPGQPSQFQEEPCIPKGVTSLSLAPDGRLLLTGGPMWGIRLFDLTSGKELRRFRGHDDGYVKVAFAPDGRRALSYSFSEFMYLWDVESGREIRRLAVPKGGTESAAFTPDGQHVVIADDNTPMVRVLDTESGQEVRSFKVADAPTYDPLSISPDGRRALSHPSEGTACLWDVAAGRKIRCFTKDADKGYLELFGRHVVYWNSQTGPSRLLDVERDQDIPDINYDLKDKHIYGISVDGRYVLISTNDDYQTYRSVDLRSGREFSTLEVSQDEALSTFTFTPDDLYILAASAGTKDSFCLWDAKSGKRLRCFKAESQ